MSAGHLLEELVEAERQRDDARAYCDEVIDELNAARRQRDRLAEVLAKWMERYKNVASRAMRDEAAAALAELEQEQP